MSNRIRPAFFHLCGNLKPTGGGGGGGRLLLTWAQRSSLRWTPYTLLAAAGWRDDGGMDDLS